MVAGASGTPDRRGVVTTDGIPRWRVRIASVAPYATSPLPAYTG